MPKEKKNKAAQYRMKAQYRLRDGAVIEVEARTQKDLFKRIAEIQAVFEAKPKRFK